MSESFINRLDAEQADFAEALNTLLAWESVSDARVAAVVDDILQQVRTRGDAAVLEYTNRFDRRQAKAMAELTVSGDQLQHALSEITADQRVALESAAQRIRQYHEH